MQQNNKSGIILPPEKKLVDKNNETLNGGVAQQKVAAIEEARARAEASQPVDLTKLTLGEALAQITADMIAGKIPTPKSVIMVTNMADDQSHVYTLGEGLTRINLVGILHTIVTRVASGR